ncbi:uncharacterized protein LOC119388379 [Rhipicephalus sanguineus]|uniref:Uncharacterized protein n=1 Tax=Rhipicephalus sanguineus TaxID=34632 RepID=A0A9D4QHL1_RHISA|nr:uncharacterized protein LOC119388379 [Rhipicephalus sanguineus]KAH7982195.1 hypothetical protein HPB52_003387 [Rhipicephalus sanguineus]
MVGKPAVLLLLVLFRGGDAQEMRVESGQAPPECRDTHGHLPGGALSYGYTKALLGRLEACILFNRRFMAENLPIELSALTVPPKIQVPPSSELKRLTEEQAFLRIYQLLVAYTTFAQHMANTSHGVASCSGHAIAANSKRSAAGAATALQVATNSQRNADQLQELRCDVRLSSAAHGSQAQFAAADASAVGLILDTYVDCSKRLLAHYSVAVGVQQLLHSMRGYLLHLVRLKSPYPGADNAEAPEVFEQASY